MKRIVFGIMKVIVVLVLPFIALIRGSVYFHEHSDITPYLALLGGLFITFVLLFVYLTFFLGRLGGRSTMKTRAVVTGMVLGSYVLYGLFYISSTNVKSTEIRQEYRSLHPILRLGISSLIMVDPDLMITDADRNQRDYQAWGLPVKERSLHYRQKSGYVHAVDLRSRGRGTFRNQLVKCYFRLMGFRVLHHGGTAEHLHISLKSHEIPWAI